MFEAHSDGPNLELGSEKGASAAVRRQVGKAAEGSTSGGFFS